MSSVSAMGATIFGTLLRRRQEMKVGQEAIASWMNISKWHFSRIENGHKDSTFEQFLRWAEFLEMEVSVAQTRKPAETAE